VVQEFALTSDSAALSISNNHADLRNSLCSAAALDQLLVNIICQLSMMKQTSTVQ